MSTGNFDFSRLPVLDTEEFEWLRKNECLQLGNWWYETRPGECLRSVEIWSDRTWLFLRVQEARPDGSEADPPRWYVITEADLETLQS